MLLGKQQNIIGHAPDYISGVARAHLAAYMPGDIEVLMQSVSPRGGIWAGMAPPHGATLIRSNEQIRETYTDLLKAVKLGETKVFVQISSDWYVFFESVSELTDVVSGATVHNQSVGLFGADEHALAIDMAWPLGTEPGPVRPKRDRAREVRSELIDLAAHQQRMHGFANEDASQACVGIVEDCQLFLPCFDPAKDTLEVIVSGVDAYKDFLSELWSIYSVADCVNCNLSIGDQYIFSDYRLKLAQRNNGNQIEIRYAQVEILDAQGCVKGILGFATQR